MEILTLPEPAAGMWGAKRRIVHAIPPEIFRSNIPSHLGGGTILAARWKHRISTDIDVLLPGRNTLIDLLQDNDRNIVDQLGGTPEAVGAGRVKIAFEHGLSRCLHLPTRPALRPRHRHRRRPAREGPLRPPDPVRQARTRRPDVRPRRLRRPDRADEDPAALAAAAGMVAQQRAAFIESAWREAAVMLADNFHDSIRGARRAAAPRLGLEAAAPFQAHRYTRLEIDLHGKTLSIRKTIGAACLEPETYAARNAGSALVESGMATHLNNNGPVTTPEVLAAIWTAVNAGSEPTILDSASRSSIDVINRLDQIDPRRPQPTVPRQAPARTRDNDHGYDC